MKQVQRGFTLIELVMVIVIIGILAAVAMPRFVNLSVSAHNAARQGLAGAITSACAIDYAQSQISGHDPAITSVESAIAQVNPTGGDTSDMSASAIEFTAKSGTSPCSAVAVPAS